MGCPIADVNVVAGLNPSVATGESNGGVRQYVHHPGYNSQQVPQKEIYRHRTSGNVAGGQGNPCTYCGRLFRSRSNLSRHVRDHHTSHDPSAAICPVCGKNCHNRSNALTHMYRVHHITARQLDAVTHPVTLPQHNASSRPEGQTDTQHYEHVSSHPIAPSLSTHSSVPTNHTHDMATHTSDTHAYVSNHHHQQQQHHQNQNQVMSYGYNIQEANTHSHQQDNT
ncbi:hypothetical protein SK128_020225 [Halocaridina rubra]|uniref:C2H2-type domain-containing protein n=1 Tax=Halocaridina rubra TaxID=373956 RepID=A0AAN8ZWB0_HALRR